MSDVAERLLAVEQLVKMFRFERMVYLTVLVLSLSMLLVCAGVVIVRSKADFAVLTPMFGSAGLITHTTGRVLRMWNDALQRVLPSAHDNGR